MDQIRSGMRYSTLKLGWPMLPVSPFLFASTNEAHGLRIPDNGVHQALGSCYCNTPGAPRKFLKTQSNQNTNLNRRIGGRNFLNIQARCLHESAYKPKFDVVALQVLVLEAATDDVHECRYVRVNFIERCECDVAALCGSFNRPKVTLEQILSDSHCVLGLRQQLSDFASFRATMIETSISKKNRQRISYWYLGQIPGCSNDSCCCKRLTYPQNTSDVGRCQKMRGASAMKFGERSERHSLDGPVKPER